MVLGGVFDVPLLLLPAAPVLGVVVGLLAPFPPRALAPVLVFMPALLPPEPPLSVLFGDVEDSGAVSAALPSWFVSSLPHAALTRSRQQPSHVAGCFVIDRILSLCALRGRSAHARVPWARSPALSS